MKILAFTDMHGSLPALRKVRKAAKEADIIVCCGDFTIFEDNIDYFLNEFNEFGKEVLLVHGNHEDEEITQALCKMFPNIRFMHEKRYVFKGIEFVGYGGGGFSTTDSHFEKIKKELSFKSKKTVFITHQPPYGAVDIVSKKHCGSKTLASFVKAEKPALMLCGHLHENFNKKEVMGVTMVMNPGPAGTIIQLE